MRKLGYIVFLLLAVWGCDNNEITTGGVTGTVIDEITQSPVAFVDITVSRVDQSAQTSTGGTFSISDIPEGSYDVTATKSGYREVSKKTWVPAGQTIKVDFSLSKKLPVVEPISISLSSFSPTGSIEVRNPGSEIMNLVITTSQSWLNVDQDNMTLAAGETKSLSATANLASVDFGSYDETITITSDGSDMTIPVNVVHTQMPEIEWQNWYLSVPINRGDGSATSIFYQDIVNDNLTPEEKEYFYYDINSGSYVMWTRYTGYTTSGEYPLNGDAYCRTELREFWRGNQTTSDNWYMGVGETHILESTLNVDYVEGTRGRTFVAQIHGKTSTIPGINNGPATVKVLWEKGEIEVEYYVKPPDPNGEWTSSYNAKSQRFRVDNEIFTIKLKVVDGVLSWALTCTAKDIDNDYVELFDYATNGYHYDNYFKTGNYFQWKQDYEKSAQVRLYKVITSHY